MNAYNFNHLYYFYVTAKLEGITLAAKFLNTSQSSLSTQIKTLEHALNKRLFRKSGRKIALTDEGRELYRYVRRAFEVFEEMFDQLNRKPNSMGVRITVGVSKEIDRPFVTDLIAKILKKYPKSRRPLINLLSLKSEELYLQLQAGQIDLLLTNKAYIDGQIRILKEFQLNVRAFVTRDLASQLKGTSFDSVLKNEDLGFVFASKLTNLRSEIDSYMVKRKARPTVVFESNIIASVVRATVDGMGITILPSAYVAREVKSESLFSLTEKPLWKHRLMAIKSNDIDDADKNEFARHFVDELQAIIDTSFEGRL